MSEETKVEATTDEVTAETTTDGAQVAIPKKKKKKWPIIVGVVAVVVIAAGAGFWVWHEQPSFCNAICHTPMDEYNVTYDQVAGEPGVDKWGNEVSNSSAMMVVSHKENGGADCLGCHVPSMAEQIQEGMNWVTGSYEYPLPERDLTELTEARGAEADQFCLNDSCHHVASDGTELNTREDLIQATSDHDRNPHEAQHGEEECGTCHKAHRASVNYCSQCHSDATIPDGWLTSQQERQLETA